jgi:hypothetical protein
MYQIDNSKTIVASPKLEASTQQRDFGRRLINRRSQIEG